MKKLRSPVPYWGIALLSLWLLSGGLVFASQNRAQARADMSKAIQAYNHGDYDTALALLEKARQLDPTLPQLKPYYGDTLYARYVQTGEENYAWKALEVYKQIYDQERHTASPDEKLLENAVTYIAAIYNQLGDQERYREWLLRKVELPGMPPEKQAEIYYSLGTSTWNAAYEITQRYLVQRQMAPTYEVPEEEAIRVRELANQGLEYIEQALTLEPEYADALSYKNLLLRELVKVESDPEVKRQLLEEANEVRRLAMELLNQRRQQEQQPPPNGSGGASDEPAPPLSLPKTLVAPPPPPPPDEHATRPLRVSGGVLQGNAIRKVQPPYPDEARKKGISGSVRVEVVIDEDGSVIAARVVSGHRLLRPAALDAARRWKFRPLVQGARPIKVTGVLVFNFRL